MGNIPTTLAQDEDVARVLRAVAAAYKYRPEILMDTQDTSQGVIAARQMAVALLATRELCPILRRDQIQDIVPMGMATIRRVIACVEKGELSPFLLTYAEIRRSLLSVAVESAPQARPRLGIGYGTILQAVAEEYSVSTQSLLGTRKGSNAPRQDRDLAIFLMSRLLRKTHAEIARKFGLLNSNVGEIISKMSTLPCHSPHDLQYRHYAAVCARFGVDPRAP